MAKDLKAFLKIGRQGLEYRPVSERIKDYKEVFRLRTFEDSVSQGHRCMDCGTPFCHWACPIGNFIPEWNDYLAHGRIDKALALLEITNNMPEITGRVCPALCEASCVLGINDDPVTIRDNELSIIEFGFEKGFIAPNPPKKRTGQRVAVIGSGPAGLACADQLNSVGHTVIVFEKDDKIGGIMRYGIPDFKLDKGVLDRRIAIWEKEGIEFKANVFVGEDITAEALLKDFDAICLAGGSRQARDLDIKGRELDGVCLAMDYLKEANLIAAGAKGPYKYDVKGKTVVVIGGGDTGADCVGVSNRRGAANVIQLEVMPRPPKERGPESPWPKYPYVLKKSTSHEEGVEQRWQVLTKEFLGKNGRLTGLKCVQVECKRDKAGRVALEEVPGTEFTIDADYAIIAIGFAHPEHNRLIKDLSVELDNRGNVKTDDTYMTSVKKVFSAGDMRRGQSLVVWAISEGRRAAYHIDRFLEGQTTLPCF